jgi:hypothetical protein
VNKPALPIFQTTPRLFCSTYQFRSYGTKPSGALFSGRLFLNIRPKTENRRIGFPIPPSDDPSSIFE